MFHVPLKILLLIGFLTFGSTLESCAANPQSIPGWGDFVDPTGDCQAGGNKDTASISLPGGHYNLNPLPQ